MGADFESFHDILKHPIRRKIIQTLNEKQTLSYVELMTAVDAANTGKFNYHLKVLVDLIQKDANGKYGLTDKGRLAVQFLQTFNEKKAESSRLRMTDAFLIGGAGFVLTLVNPGFWAFMLAAAWNVQSVAVYSALSALTTAFMIVVPGPVMWLLSTRRSHSHIAYDLYKAPCIAVIMLVLLLVVMFVSNINIGTQVAIQVGETVSTGNIQVPGGPTVSSSHTTYSMMVTSLSSVMVFGMVSAFVGVALAELVSQLKKKLRK
jgi:hypothetical protein